MASLARVILSLVLLIGGTLPTLGSPPRISRTEDEIVFQENETFKLQCEGKEFVFWNHTIPEEFAHSDLSSYNLFDRMKVTYVVNTESDYPFVAELEVPDANPSDTGYFYCLNNGTTDHDDPRNVDKIYVYVNSTTELLAFEHTYIVMLTSSESQPITLPCRPTSPDVTVMLFLYEEQVYPPESENDHEEPWKFDPRRGFFIDSAIIESHAHMFTCKATAPYTEKEAELVTQIQIIPNHPGGLPTPIIRDATDGYFTVGDTITLNCSIEFILSASVVLKWEMPSEAAIQENRSEVTQRLESATSSQYRRSMSKLVIRNASKADEGVYVCRASDHRESETTNASKVVKIHDPHMSYVNLYVVETITENATLNAQWVVNIDANPDPVRIWRKPNGEEIKAGVRSRFEIRQDRRMSVLNISGLTLEDAGVYTFTAIAGNVSRTVNLTLYVRDRPKVKFASNSDSMVLLNKAVSMTCEVDAYPKPEIRFLFRPCLPRWNCSKNYIELKRNEINATEIQEKSYRVQSKIVVKANKSGEYVCQACNPGCDNKTVNVQVSDVADGFKLTGPGGNAVEGSYVSLACSLSLFKYQKAVTWFYTDAKGQEVVLAEGNQLHGYSVIKQSTEFSYVEKLDFPRITQGDSGKYKCQVLDYADRKQNSTPISLRVLAVQAPEIVNGSSSPEIRVRPGDQVDMLCNGSGIPEPVVQWYKDGEKYDGFEHENGGESAVKFQYVKAENAGTYKCVYNNTAGSKEKVFQLYVDEHAAVSTAVIAGVVCAAVIFLLLLVVLAFKIYQEKKREKIFKVKNLEEFLNGDLTSMNRDLAIDEQAELLPYDKQWEFPRERLKLGKQLGSGAFGRVVKAEATGISQEEAISVVAVKMVKTHANYTAFKALLSELKIMIHLGSHLNVVNLLGACTKNVAKGELFVIVEYCKFGNIQNYLIRHRDKFVNQIDPIKGMIDPNIGAERFAKLSEAAAEAARFAEEGYEVPTSPGPLSPGARSIVSQTSSAFPRESVSSEVTYITTGVNSPEDSSGQPMLNSQGSNIQAPWRSNYKGDYSDNMNPLRTQDLLCWGFQIARGMEYLTSRKVLHGDLAARNVLLAENNIVKICDFGLAREVCKGENYKKKGGDPLPVKWMAVESIFDRVFSTQSDVWSFGIVIWEIFSLGKTPYPDMQADEAFFKKIQEGYRMDCPKYANSDIYKVMTDCWLLDPRERPSFTDLQERLGNLLEASVRRHYIDLNTPYMMLNDERKASDYLDMVSSPDYTFMARPSPARDHDYVNTQEIVNTHRNNDYLNNDVSLASNHAGDVASNSSSDYLLMSPVSAQTPDVFSPRGTNAYFDFDLKPGKLPRVDEEEPQSIIELKPMLNFGDNATEVNENFVDKTAIYNGKKMHPDPTRQDSGFYSPTSRSFSNPNYAPGFPFPSQALNAEPDDHLTQNFVADPKCADLNAPMSLPKPIPKSSPMFTAL